MDSEDGQNLAYFVRTHERALANALQLQQRNKNGQQQASGSSSDATTISLSDALSRPFLPFTTASVRPAKLTLTPHHLFYLLSKFEDLGVDVGPMNVRLENLQYDAGPANYVSFLGHAPKSRGKQSDAESMKSVSSVRSVMSSMSSMLSNLGLSNSAARAEKQMAQHRDDIKYLYSCFTKIPALKLSPDHRARLISGYEEFPFDTAVPLFAFKNVSALEICDLDFRQFYGWDRLSEQLRSLTVKRANVDDPIDLLQHIVLDDTERRRKRSFKTPLPTTPSTPGAPWPGYSPKPKHAELARTFSAPNSPYTDQRRGSKGSPLSVTPDRKGSVEGKQPATPSQRQRSISPPRVLGSRHGSLRQHARSGSLRYRRSSGSSGSDTHEMPPSRHSSTDMLILGILPSSKWRMLRHLSLAENGLTSLAVSSLSPVANTLQSLDLSGNLFSDVPDALASLTHLRALNLSNCMIDSLQSLSRSPLPAITTLNLRSNRLSNLAGIERLPSLERVDVRDNRLRDPMELARLAGLPEVIDIYVIKNPFERTHPDYRVTIFNAFRSTPGHTEDVTIDTFKPLSHEKKYLVDRAPEPVNVPVVKPPPEVEEEPQAVVGGAPTEDELRALEDLPQEARHQRQGHRRTTSDLGPMANRRKKKAPRRRIVELSQQETPQTLTMQQPAPELTQAPKTPTDSEPPTTPGDTPYHTAPTRQVEAQLSRQRPTLDIAFDSPTPAPKIRDPSDDDDELSLQDLGQSDVYRQKMEALKSDLGPNWLAAMNEDRLAEQRDQRRSFSPASRTSTIKATGKPGNERGVSTGGRTLG
ncbi:uncharacterized protein LTR77_003412 [Saxophila tyrrhenica]|uniref:Leucine-rich repeat-containing protein n=1 Tax=Saxophila tyrrhenica TaxID=1690608 RepID=A0AAV9PGI1_9PEZI|nr:hypothetical protein LTR77_003412 [Saxophila tyrrhenica]